MKKAGIIKLHNKKSNVFIVANLSRKAVIPCAERLIALLKKHKIGIAMDLSARETFTEAEVEFVSAKDGFAAARRKPRSSTTSRFSELTQAASDFFPT